MITNEQDFHLLPPDEFNQFFEEVVNVVFDAREHPCSHNVSIRHIMDQYDIQLPPGPTNLIQAINPALDANIYGPTAEVRNACPVCSLCTLCILCGELNGAAGLANLTGIFSIAG
ncbi:MAG: hypothetical protein WC142_08810 [Bacteroidales bacterium]|jgi:hypothetical protein|nr:hypothetical protein [Bacteroidales bacterium]MDD3331198.1 hypothetical protein [Bacteroidales bacterium]MDD3692130.1 hypothetical protein [Bacteroidales bacterium]MDX9889422.1 hypothetical protein [Bacteroidales bacterium]